MRFLHTADWHVGRTIRGRSRISEMEEALDKVVSVARESKVGAVVVAGDVYDQRALSAEADELVYDTLLRLGDSGIQVVMIPGNHDSAPRLRAVAPLLARVHTSAVYRVLPPDAGGRVIVGDAAFTCIPFVAPRRFADATNEFGDIAHGYNSFDEGMGRLLSAYEDAFDDAQANVVVMHGFVSGAKPAGSEREVTIGADYAVTPSRLPATASYVALGHIHRPQRVRGAPCDARYAGSLLQLDFGEQGQKKTLLIVEVEPRKPPRVEEIRFDAGRALMDLEGTLDDLPTLAASADNAYLRVTMHVEAPIPGIAERVREVLPNALDVRVALPESETEQPSITMKGLDPRSQFAHYYRDAHGSDPSDELLGAFDRVHEEVVT